MKKNALYPVSVVICALNEEHRIKDTIESARRNFPSEIIVIEGGSTDNTFEIAKKYADKVFRSDVYGLGYKRALGVETASQKYILNLDADQILEDDALSIMIEELEESGFIGIQACLKGTRNETYWEKAMGYNVGITHSQSRESNMIGTPALYKLSELKVNNFDKTISGSCDDTDLCYRLVKKGYKLGISTAICYQKHRSNFKTTQKKFLWYGEGDCEFAFKHPERFWSIYTHPLRNYCIKKSLFCLKKGDFKFVPFFLFTGIMRHLGFYKFLFKNIFGKKLDSRVLNRNDKDF